MRLIRYREYEDGPVRAGLVEQDRVHELAEDIFGPYTKTGRGLALADAILEAPCRPGKIVCVGLNYRDHVAESQQVVPEEPVLFMKPTSAVIGPGRAIRLPRHSRRVDYEAELAVIMGRTACRVRADEALDYVLGYTCLNDVSARDFQRKDGQWTRAKGFYTFCPLGPAIETGFDPGGLAVQAWLNGELKQDSSTACLIFNVPFLIEFISGIMRLEPGDVIATGTPSGVGPLQAGDEIEIRVGGIGGLINPVRLGDDDTCSK
jgi:2-keto-4-pentenoate hydratase/2-oxohepta-3-ene-1,7-dioic acid hydratase in catechol pathway